MVPLMVMPTMTRLASLLGGMGRLAKVYCGELVVPLAAGCEAEGGNGDQKAAEGLGRERLGNETSILQREQLQNLSAAACYFGHCYTGEYNKERV